ncbi:SPT2 chromatin protein-domain-containing protein [Chytriomyces sp. MP71]|nr:SPT2 chromatin protein-domain-containing protein [Chytriomyces sp. MP71]
MRQAEANTESQTAIAAKEARLRREKAEAEQKERERREKQKRVEDQLLQDKAEKETEQRRRKEEERRRVAMTMPDPRDRMMTDQKKAPPATAPAPAKKPLSFSQLMKNADKVSLNDPVSISDLTAKKNVVLSSSSKNLAKNASLHTVSKGGKSGGTKTMELIPLGGGPRRHEKSAAEVLDARADRLLLKPPGKPPAARMTGSLSPALREVDAPHRSASASPALGKAGTGDARKASLAKEVDPRRVPGGKEVDPRRIPVGKEVDPRRIPVGRVVDPRKIPIGKEVDPRRISVGKEVDPRKIPADKEVDPRRIPVGKEVDPRHIPAAKDTAPRKASSTKETRNLTGNISDARISSSTSTLAPKRDVAAKGLKRPRDDAPAPARKRDYDGVTGDDIWSILGVKRRPAYYDDDSDDMEVGFSSVRAEESRSAKLARLEDEEEERREKERLRKKGKLKNNFPLMGQAVGSVARTSVVGNRRLSSLLERVMASGIMGEQLQACIFVRMVSTNSSSIWSPKKLDRCQPHSLSTEGRSRWKTACGEMERDCLIVNETSSPLMGRWLISSNVDHAEMVPIMA